MHSERSLQAILDFAKPFIYEPERDIPNIHKAYETAEKFLQPQEVKALLEQAEISVMLIGLGAKAVMSVFLRPCFARRRSTRTSTIWIQARPKNLRGR